MIKKTIAEKSTIEKIAVDLASGNSRFAAVPRVPTGEKPAHWHIVSASIDYNKSTLPVQVFLRVVTFSQSRTQQSTHSATAGLAYELQHFYFRDYFA